MAPDPREPGKLSREAIVEAALAVIETGGIDALTVRALSNQLGAPVMSLYVYFRTKDEILDACADAAVGALPIVYEADSAWPDQLFSLYRHIERAVSHQPRTLELFLRRPIAGPGINRLRETVFAILRTAGFSNAEATKGFGVLYAYSLGFTATAYLAHRSGDSNPSASPQDHPFLYEAGPGFKDHASAATHDAGLRYLIAGLEDSLASPPS